MTKKIFLICMMFLVTISIGLCSFSYRIDIKNNLIKLIKKSQISSNLNTGTINKNNETKKYTPSPYSAKKIINEDNLPKNIVKSNKPEISLNIITNYYNIQGLTENDLRRQMNTFGPTDSYGRYDAYTKWDITWTKTCNGLPSVGVKIVFTYPQWLKPDNPDSNLESKWTRYIEALKNHESGHRDIAIRAAQEIMDTLYNLAKTNNCIEQSQRVTTLGNNIIDKYKQEEIKYDNLTNHGNSQGAVFP
jgi:predicted secreted Zn-dependent protease